MKYIPRKEQTLNEKLNDGIRVNQNKLDQLAVLYNKTKDKKYYDEWFDLVKKLSKQISC
jgi:hypothetical protein